MILSLVPAAAAEGEGRAAQEAPVLPGYTLLESVPETGLDPERYYLVVSQDSDGTPYALYADPDGLTADSGNAVDTSKVAEGLLVAQLTVEGETVSAVHLSDDAALTMDELHFITAAANGGYSFQSNGIYLSLSTGHMFAETPVALTVAANASKGGYTIRNAGQNRVLDFNKAGDPNEFVGGGKTFATNFWGPRGNSFPIYLYTLDGTVVEPDKDALQAAVDNAAALVETDYTPATWADLQEALTAARAALDKEDATVTEVNAALAALNAAVDALFPAEPDLAEGKPEPGTTEDQPFDFGTGGSDLFRIPSLITLQDGSLLAAIDARWNTTVDAGGLDTIVSRSTDGGKTWNYSFANYFNDSTNKYHNQATAFIDPVMVQGNDGTIYLMVDVWPGGVALNSAETNNPEQSSGYITVNGEYRLALYASPKPDKQDDNNHTHYVGVFAEDGYAPVYARDGGDPVYYVDDHYYLYDTDKSPLYCQQLGSDKYVQQNVFFYNADLHVRATSHLWLVTSDDNGETWSAPVLLNEQVRTGLSANHGFYGVGPGAGLCLEDGTIMLPCYTFTAGVTNSDQLAGFIYTSDGETWHRAESATSDAVNHWSSESCMVQIDENTVRHFYRDGFATLYYTDHTLQDDGSWKAGEPVDTGVSKTYNNQLSLVKYSKKINGKDAFILSTADGGGRNRSKGKLYTLVLNEDKTLSLAATFPVNQTAYGYSSIAELEDGSIGLLYETDNSAVVFRSFDILDVANGAVVDGVSAVRVPLYGTAVLEGVAATEEELASVDPAIAKATVEGGVITFTGVKEGRTQFTSDGITYSVRVFADKLQSVDLKVGETKAIEMAKGEITHASDPAIAETKIEMIDTSDDIQALLGGDGTFSESQVSLKTALYHFAGNSTDGYTISAKTADGQSVYVDMHPSSANNPNTANAEAKVSLRRGYYEDTFYLADGQGSYWYFDRSADSSVFFWVGAAKYQVQDSLLLYRPAADGEASSEELPGYVKVMPTAGAAEDTPVELPEGDYLIVAKVDSRYFTMYPSTGSNYRYHIAKVKTPVYPALTMTGVSVGVTDVMVDGVIYRITVTDQSSGGDDDSSSVSRYPVIVEKAEGGSIELSKARAAKGDTVTVTVKASAGYKLDTLTVTDAKGNALKLTDKGSGKYTFTMPASRVTVKAAFGGTAGMPFTDVAAGSWYYDAVRSVYANGLMSGVSATKFAPDVTTTRGMVVTVLHNLENRPAAGAAAFSDVTAGMYCEQAVAWAAANGIVAGYGDGRFGPNDTVTREQFAVILYRYAQYKQYDVAGRADLSRFTDAGSVSGYAADAMAWAVHEGLISGVGNNVLAPGGDATRAQTAMILSSFLNSLSK